MSAMIGPTGDGGIISKLDQGETWTYTGSYIVTQANMDAGSPIINRVPAYFVQTAPHSAGNTVDVDQSPDFAVVKEADVSSVSVAGQIIHYTITVHNTGNISLRDRKSVE